MKTYKTFDIITGSLLIVIFTTLSIVNRDGTFLKAYAIVGGWQVISMMVHAANGWFSKKGGKRARYHYIVLTLLAGFALLLLFYFTAPSILFIFLPFLLFMILAAPFLALYYIFLCLTELALLKERPLARLK